jgi:DNA-binding transcriptional ArsR family regulator
MSKHAIVPLVEALKVLAHPVRLRILAMLRGGELCVCQIVEVLGAEMSTISGHLNDLRRAGYLEERKDGRRSYYRFRQHSRWETLTAAIWPQVDALPEVARDARAAGASRADGPGGARLPRRKAQGRMGRGAVHAQ